MGRENNLELKAEINIEFLREKGETEFETLLYSYNGLIFQHDDFKLSKGRHSPCCRAGDLGQYITNNNNNNNKIRIIIKELGKNRKGERRMRRGRWDYLRQHLEVASLTEKEQKEDICLYTGGRRDRLRFPHGKTSPPGPGLMSILYDVLSDQVPVEVIRNLLVGTWRWDWWPRDHMMCCQEERKRVRGWIRSYSTNLDGEH
jgi:hypothetical protein